MEVKNMLFREKKKSNAHRNITFTFTQNDLTFATSESKTLNKKQYGKSCDRLCYSPSVSAKQFPPPSLYGLH